MYRPDFENDRGAFEMSFPRYPKYKASGVEWLGDVPVEWEVSRLGFETWVRARLGWKGLKAEEYVDEGFAFLSTPNIKGQDIDFVNVNFIDQKRFDESPEIKIRQGDVLLAKDGSTLGTVNVVRRLPRSTTVNSSIAVITPNSNLNGLYLYYLFGTTYMVHTIERSKGGMGVPHLFQSDINKFYLPLPPLAEQVAVAAFLDRETGKIDELVAEQKRLMGLLKEKRQAVISHAVTKGLNAHAKMKPSGVEWLGDVPEGWEVTKIKRLASRISSGKTPLGGSEVYVDDGITFLRSQNIYDEGLRLDDVVFITESVDEAMAVSRVKANDILLNITGASIGRSCVVPNELPPANVNQHVCVIRLENPTQVPFVGWLFKSATIKNQIDHAQNGAAREGLNFVQIGEMAVALPPASEQEAIAKFMNLQTKQLEALTAEAQRAIDLLQERRTALISAAVTAQIDVRKINTNQGV